VSGDPVGGLLRSFREEVAKGVSSRAEFERLKGRFVGREKGLLPGLFSSLKDLPPADRRAFGRHLNAAKTEIEEGIRRLSEALSAR
jgi:hypothetical protein